MKQLTSPPIVFTLAGELLAVLGVVCYVVTDQHDVASLALGLGEGAFFVFVGLRMWATAWVKP